ncbi:MAG TPA: chemotaxis protein CheA [Methylophilaceae bacterium]|nr:chemotaxis protein CheA [Methylophilaceae bacterium]
MNLDEALNTYILESRELLEQMEGALLQSEQAAPDQDTINAIFRAAHTIKGSAGLFGLDHIVAFTHEAESVLDKVRNGEIAFEVDLVALMLLVCDHLRVLVDAVAAGEPPADSALTGEQALMTRLQNYLGFSGSNAEADGADVLSAVEELGTAGTGPLATTDNWHISLQFGSDVLRNGMDPLSFIRYLATIGRIVSIVTVTDALPPAQEMDAESCYLGFEINFASDADKAAIESVFDFVREDSRIRILPPRSRVSEYLALIEVLPMQDMRLGEILMRCGTLTEAELQQALEHQAGAATSPSKPVGEILIEQGMVQSPVVAAALEKQKTTREVRSEASLIRVDAVKLDQLINLVGELIIAGAGAGIIAQRQGSPEMLEAMSAISRLVEEVRDSALALRMVQIGSTFNRFQRVVRDVSRELGKDIQLQISGEDTELDKTVVEKIGDPLTHLVRNAMDHGIEPAAVRLAAGKPAQGTLRLNAYHDAGNIIIEVSDDGGGLNKAKILAKAIDKGLIKPEQQLADKDIYNLIFEAGFSTADTVSNLSGRGVGMDVVRRNIEALRGSIEIDSVASRGTTMCIRLPLTLAIIDGFMVGVGDSAYVIPLDMVIECIELSAEDQAAAEAGNREYINLRGEVLPYLKLRDQFGVGGNRPHRSSIVVVQYAGNKAGLVVDMLMGEFQAVIKPLGRIFSKASGISSFTILGNGKVALILDVPVMLQQAATPKSLNTS